MCFTCNRNIFKQNNLLERVTYSFQKQEVKLDLLRGGYKELEARNQDSPPSLGFLFTLISVYLLFSLFKIHSSLVNTGKKWLPQP